MTERPTEADRHGPESIGGRPELAIDRRAPVSRLQLDDTSWVDLVRGFIPDHEALLGHLLTTVDWQESLVWRYEKYLTEPRMGARVADHQLPAALRQARLHLESRYRKRFDTPVLIRYRDGRDSVGVHRDREMRWLDDTLIAISVLGEPRPFILRPITARRDDATHDIDLAPGRGDLLVMGGRAQADWLHGVPKVARATERISITWRWSSRQGRPDPSASYRAPRNFGDSGRAGPQHR